MEAIPSAHHGRIVFVIAAVRKEHEKYIRDIELSIGSASNNGGAEATVGADMTEDEPLLGANLSTVPQMDLRLFKTSYKTELTYSAQLLLKLL